VLHRVAFPVVSEWYQYRSHDLSRPVLKPGDGFS
jgi:hypothetical protein